MKSVVFCVSSLNVMFYKVCPCPSTACVGSLFLCIPEWHTFVGIPHVMHSLDEEDLSFYFLAVLTNVAMNILVQVCV